MLKVVEAWRQAHHGRKCRLVDPSGVAKPGKPGKGLSGNLFRVHSAIAVRAGTRYIG